MNIVLIEFNSHHDECIFSQVAFLKTLPDVKLYLISNYRLEGRMDYLDKFDDVLFVRSNQWGIGHLRVLKFINKNNINKVVFNTIPNKSVNNLLKICSKDKREYFGILHDCKQLNNTKYLRTFNVINSFYLLNDYLLKNIENYNTLPNRKFQAFYPIFFKEQSKVELTKGKDELWITIPGKMELGRRDYKQLLEYFKKGNLNKNIKLVFLGRSNDNIRKEFDIYDSNNSCVFWDGYIENEIFHSYLEKSDYILPLIHSDNDSTMVYRDKISGCFNLAFSYQKPMILSSFFNQFEDFKTIALFYKKGEDIIDVLNKLETPNYKFDNEKWSFEYQKNRYVKFLQY